MEKDVQFGLDIDLSKVRVLNRGDYMGGYYPHTYVSDLSIRIDVDSVYGKELRGMFKDFPAYIDHKDIMASGTVRLVPCAWKIDFNGVEFIKTPSNSIARHLGLL